MTLDDKLLEGRSVRLFPSHHISSNREAELRAAASLLAVARAVSEFGRAFVSMAGGSRGSLECYTEVPFKTEQKGKKDDRPDGLIRVRRGKTEWKALVEVKVGDNPLSQEQFDRYHVLARGEGINALITISNQAALPNGLPPDVQVDGRRLRSVPVYHLSWERLLSEARMLSQRKQIADSDQQWMLEEWVRYIADDGSRIIEPPQLGENWGQVIRAAREGNLATHGRQISSVARHWDAFLRKMGLRLRAKLGAEVQLRMTKAERCDPAVRLQQLQTCAIKDGELCGRFKVRGAAGDLRVAVSLASKTVRYGIELKAPTEGRTKTRINWLLRQLRGSEAPTDLLIKVLWDPRKYHSQARLRNVFDNPDSLMTDTGGTPIPREALPYLFSLARSVPLCKGRGRSTAPILEGIASGMEEFYRSVVEQLRPFVPRAPQLTELERSQKEDSKSERQQTTVVESMVRVPSTADQSEAEKDVDGEAR